MLNVKLLKLKRIPTLILGLLLVLGMGCGAGVDNDNIVNKQEGTPKTADDQSGETSGLVSSVETQTVVVTTQTDFPANVPTAQGACNGQQLAGNDVPEERVIEMGKTSGTFEFQYNSYSKPDRMFVVYQGTTLFDTTCVGTGSTVSKSLTYSGTSSKVTVQVVPNCTGGTGTGWTFTITCP